jgi:hypothetical protein
VYQNNERRSTTTQNKGIYDVDLDASGSCSILYQKTSADINQQYNHHLHHPQTPWAIG